MYYLLWIKECLFITRRKCLKLLTCDKLKVKIRLHKRRKRNNDVKLRFEYEGSYLCEYYISYEHATYVLQVNKGNIIYNGKSNFIVFSLYNRILCILC